MRSVITKIDRTTCNVPFLCDEPSCPRSLMPAIHATQKKPAVCFLTMTPTTAYGLGVVGAVHLYCSEACARGKPKKPLRGFVVCPNCQHRWKP